jgi:predicted ATPase/DNA-binding CsgD family transcriptional regulator
LITDLPIGYVRIEMGLTNFPVQLTSFIGREREVADVKRLLLSSHLVTLTGAGGSGKTRLAIQIASIVSENFSDGVWLVDLASLREPALVLQLVAQVFGLRPSADQSLLETLLSFLRPKHLLLILDNCEHLREACVQLAQVLLSQSPELRILATSREPLAIAGETIYPVSGLAWPAVAEKLEVNLQDLMQFEAVRLFVERARAIAPDFNLTPENARSTVDTCRRLDGLPLALELASARVNVLTVQEIAHRLDDRFELLIPTQHVGIELRHATLRAAIDWSYDLLTTKEQALLCRLAVFEAGCTLDTAESVCSGEDIAAQDILNLISSLINKSLVVAETVGRTQARYRLLETIREYALEKLEEVGQKERLRDRHLDWFLAQAEEAAPKLIDTYQQLWLNWLEGEHDNLRAALAWSLSSDQIEAGLRITIALYRFWEIRGYVLEGMTWFERLLAQADEGINVVVRANACTYAAFLAMFLGNTSKAMDYGLEAVSLAEAADDKDNSILILALGGLASGTQAAGDYQTAFTIQKRMIQLLRHSPGDPFVLGMVLFVQGEAAIVLGHYDTARTLLDESLAMAREAGDAFRSAHALNAFGDLARCEQDYAEAQSNYEQSAALLHELGALRDRAYVLQNLGSTCLYLGDLERALGCFRESMAAHQVQQNAPGMLECLPGFATTTVMAGLPGPGVRLLAASAALSRQPSSPAWKATRLELERYYELARASLTESEFVAEQAAGRAMSLEQAVDFALNLPIKQGIAPKTGKTPGDLTRREREVAALIGQGKTNGEIASELFLSKRTVETHVSKILSKLGLTSRGQVIRWAIDQGLT